MIFKRKKPGAEPAGEQHVMRSRDRFENGASPDSDADNPLARRFQPDDEPDTIDLQPGQGFPAAEEERSTTRDLSPPGDDSASAAPNLQGFISLAPDTGKFYLQPGTPGQPVYLGDQEISAPTELRRGDRVRIGDACFEFLS